MSANQSNAGTRSCLVWVHWLPLSENRVRRLHWSKVHAHNASAKAAWRSSLQSSSAAADFVTTTIRRRAEQKLLGTKLPHHLDTTTETLESDSNTANAKPQ